MPSVLITAFQPYDSWSENSSWLTLVELTKALPSMPQITTRLYPVDLTRVQENLASDLAANYDYALHLGQSPGTAGIRLEALGINVACGSRSATEEYEPLVPDGPVAYRSTLPLADWSRRLRDAGIPSQVSYQAGTYLCNAVLYLSHYLAEQQNLKTRITLIHLPLELSQTRYGQHDLPALPRSTLAAAIRLILGELASASP